MTKNTRHRAPDERLAIAYDLAINAASLPLQSPTMHTSESNTLSREYTVTQSSLPVKTTKPTRYVQETSSFHPPTLGRTVTQLSLPVIQTAPKPHHIQHTNKDSQRRTYIPLTHTPQRQRPLNTEGKRTTSLEEKGNPHQSPRN